jgi:hypothetical protein
MKLARARLVRPVAAAVADAAATAVVAAVMVAAAAAVADAMAVDAGVTNQLNNFEKRSLRRPLFFCLSAAGKARKKKTREREDLGRAGFEPAKA